MQNIDFWQHLEVHLYKEFGKYPSKYLNKKSKLYDNIFEIFIAHFYRKFIC